MSRLFISDPVVGALKDNELTESVVEDVFNNGETGINEKGERFAVKKYNGYEIGITFGPSDKVNFDYNINSLWRRDRAD
jgi:hypothetical protein